VEGYGSFACFGAKNIGGAGGKILGTSFGTLRAGLGKGEKPMKADFLMAIKAAIFKAMKAALRPLEEKGLY